MVLNPDVTVRARGVMEKCNFCVQRCQEGKLNAKKEDRPIKRSGSENCLYAGLSYTCYSMFGNVNDKESKIAKLRCEGTSEQKILCL